MHTPFVKAIDTDGRRMSDARRCAGRRPLDEFNGSCTRCISISFLPGQMPMGQVYQGTT